MPHSGKDVAPKARILVVGLEKALFEAIKPLLTRSHFQVDRVPRGGSGLALAGHVPFDLVVARHPLPDTSVADLLRALRCPGCPCAGSHVVVLADEPARAEAQAQAPGETVLSVSEPSQLLAEVATRLLGVAHRLSTRLLVRLEVRLPQGRTLVMCQTENLSEGGMFLRTNQDYPVGTTLGFEMLLTGERIPTAGEAEVVRHADAGVEKVRGVGVRFVSLKGDSLRQIRDFVAKNAPARSHPARAHKPGPKAAAAPAAAPQVAPRPGAAPRPARPPVSAPASRPSPPPPAPVPVEPPPPPAPELPPTREVRERCHCQACRRPFLLVYEAEPDEGQELADVACPHCWQKTRALVAESVATTGDFRAEKAG